MRRRCREQLTPKWETACCIFFTLVLLVYLIIQYAVPVVNEQRYGQQIEAMQVRLDRVYQSADQVRRRSGKHIRTVTEYHVAASFQLHGQTVYVSARDPKLIYDVYHDGDIATVYAYQDRLSLVRSDLLTPTWMNDAVRRLAPISALSIVVLVMFFACNLPGWRRRLRRRRACKM